MTYILLYVLTFLMGISLGLLGSGGSILLVPVMTYVLGMNPVKAADYSLFVVGIATMIGVARSWSMIKKDLSIFYLLGLPSIVGIFLMRKMILPSIPPVLFTTQQGDFTLRNLIMIMFAIMMTIVARNMITPVKANANTSEPNSLVTIVLGIFVGMLSGLLGVGGGFILVPILVLLYHRAMPDAVNVSLLFIATNSLFGFSSAFPLKEMRYDMLLWMTTACVLGMLIGLMYKSKIDAQRLKVGFGWFIAFIGLIIFGIEIFKN